MRKGEVKSKGRGWDPANPALTNHKALRYYYGIRYGSKLKITGISSRRYYLGN